MYMKEGIMSTDTEFIDFMKELILAPDSAIKKAYMERAVKIIEERACCLPTNDWGHTMDCPRWHKDAYASLEIKFDNVKKELATAKPLPYWKDLVVNLEEEIDKKDEIIGQLQDGLQNLEKMKDAEIAALKKEMQQREDYIEACLV
jgi:hypothetical protein